MLLLGNGKRPTLGFQRMPDGPAEAADVMRTADKVTTAD